mmetsp:Transcript_17083/g.35272  ORF Transcript_17083/g.35272 Transcript_17083/m.35272 type:complete len:96 (+) Transcript_17083:897-1184(+)
MRCEYECEYTDPSIHRSTIECTTKQNKTRLGKSIKTVARCHAYVLVRSQLLFANCDTNYGVWKWIESNRIESNQFVIFRKRGQHIALLSYIAYRT